MVEVDARLASSVVSVPKYCAFDVPIGEHVPVFAKADGRPR
jgi:hypothetical protein